MNFSDSQPKADAGDFFMPDATKDLEFIRDEIKQLDSRIGKLSFVSFVIICALFITISSAFSLIKNSEIDFAVNQIREKERDTSIAFQVLWHLHADTSTVEGGPTEIPPAIQLFQEDYKGPYVGSFSDTCLTESNICTPDELDEIAGQID